MGRPGNAWVAWDLGAQGRLLAESEMETFSGEEVRLPSAITGWHYCSPQA